MLYFSGLTYGYNEIESTRSNAISDIAKRIFAHLQFKTCFLVGRHSGAVFSISNFCGYDQGVEPNQLNPVPRLQFLVEPKPIFLERAWTETQAKSNSSYRFGTKQFKYISRQWVLNSSHDSSNNYFFTWHSLLADCYDSRVALCARITIDNGYLMVTTATSAGALALLKSAMPVVFCGRKVVSGLCEVSISHGAPNSAKPVCEPL